MAYEKTVWVDGQQPPINAENLNKIEQGIYDMHHPTVIAPSSVTVNAGTTTDLVADMQVKDDGNLYTISDVAAAPGIDLEVNFANVTTLIGIVVDAYYNGSTSHAVRLQLWDKDTEAWNTFHTLMLSLDQQQSYLRVLTSAPYIDSGVVKMRFYHTEVGNPSHDLLIDAVLLVP